MMKESISLQVKTMKSVNEIFMKGEIVIFGSTYMSGFPFYELINRSVFENAIYNRSIAGLTVNDALEIVTDCVIALSPRKIFLALGEEDQDDPEVIEKYKRLIDKICQSLPECRLYLIGLTGKSEYEQRFNCAVRAFCDNKRIKYIELITKQLSEVALYKARFKQLSVLFRDRMLTVSELFTVADV